jgi:hypothetical protein
MSSHQLSQLLGNSGKLMKVTFRLKSDANKEVSNYMRRGVRELKTGYSCHPNSWDSKRQRVKGRTQDVKNLNSELDKLQYEEEKGENKLDRKTIVEALSHMIEVSYVNSWKEGTFNNMRSFREMLIRYGKLKHPTIYDTSKVI